MTMANSCRAILFDKDGTLFDFERSWAKWLSDTLLHVANGDTLRAARVAREVGFDWQEKTFHTWSPIIHGSPEDLVVVLAEEFSDRDIDELDSYLFESGINARMIEFVPLLPLLENLSDRGLVLGVVTNDYEQLARSQLQDHGVENQFIYIAGYDSGYGVKPDPGMLLEFSRQTSIPPSETIMVGDSEVDLLAARNAGMTAMAVENGVGDTGRLKAHADIMLSSIARLPEWLDIHQGTENTTGTE